MKKIIIVLIFVLTCFMSTKFISASAHHENFEELKLSRGKLLSDYSSSDLDSYYKKVKKAKFSGWKTEVINNRVKAQFVSETHFSYYNDGYTSIDYSYKIDEQTTSKYSFSSTGSVSVNATKTKTGFKNGLDSSLKLSYSQDKQTVKKETYEIKVKVDPGTQVNLYSYGEGRLTNGVAARYLFWIRTSLGGYEVFEISTLYQKLEKIRI